MAGIAHGFRSFLSVWKVHKLKHAKINRMKMSWEINYRVWLMEKFISSRILKRVWAKGITEPVMWCSKKSTVSLPGLPVLNLHILKETGGCWGSLEARVSSGNQGLGVSSEPISACQALRGSGTNQEQPEPIDGWAIWRYVGMSGNYFIHTNGRTNQDDFSQRSRRRESCWPYLPNISPLHRPHPATTTPLWDSCTTHGPFPFLQHAPHDPTLCSRGTQHSL